MKRHKPTTPDFLQVGHEVALIEQSSCADFQQRFGGRLSALLSVNINYFVGVDSTKRRNDIGFLFCFSVP